MKDTKECNEDTAETNPDMDVDKAQSTKSIATEKGESVEESKEVDSEVKSSKSEASSQKSDKESKDKSGSPKQSQGEANPEESKIKNDSKKQPSEADKQNEEAKVDKTNDENTNASTKQPTEPPDIKYEELDYSEFPEGTITQLSKNGIREFLINCKSWGRCDPRNEIIVQIVSLKEMKPQPGKSIRMRLEVSDGVSKINVVLLYSKTPEENAPVSTVSVLRL